MPILILIGTDDLELATQAVQMGAQDYLVKGQVTTNLLVRSIRHAIERFGLMMDLMYAAQELHARESHMRDLIDGSADGIVVLDREGKVLFVNPAAESLFGRNAQELMAEAFDFPLVAGKTTQVDFTPDGSSPRIADMRVSESRWDGQGVYLASFRDVTPRRRAEETARKYQTQHLFRSVFRNLGRRASTVLYRAGVDAGASTFRFLTETWEPRDDEDAVRAIEEYFRITRLFKLRSLRIDRESSTAAAQVQESLEATQSSENTHDPACHFLRGLFRGLGERILGVKKLECAENACEALGDPACEFFVQPVPD